MVFSVREYLYWTFVPDPTKYSRLVKEDTQVEAMTYMSANATQWGARAYLSGGEMTEFKLLGHLVTSPHLPVYLTYGTVIVASLAFGIAAAEAGGFDQMVDVTSGRPSIQQGLINRWGRKLH